MPVIIFFLLLLLFAPWALGLFLVFLLIFLFVFIPLGFAAQSFMWLILGPGQLLRVLFNKKVRRNHALEHATVNVIEERYGPSNIAGMAYEDGFTPVSYTHLDVYKRQVPGRWSAGIWKHSDLPPPVGMSTKASWPSMRPSMISRCRGRKLS